MCLSSVLMKVWGLQNAEESADSEWVRQYIYSDLTDFSKQCNPVSSHLHCMHHYSSLLTQCFSLWLSLSWKSSSVTPSIRLYFSMLFLISRWEGLATK